MNKTRSPLPVIAVGALALAAGCQRSSPELADYLEKIRASGMSESAESSIRTVASIRVRQTLLMFDKEAETGRYDRVYRSGSCPLPGATPEQLEVWKKRTLEGTQKELNRLKPLADLDRSGFVTTEEGARFRNIFEFGVEAAYICQHEPCTPASISHALGIAMPVFSDLLSSYQDLRRRALKFRIDGFAPVPLVEAKEERQ
ncbi:MAG: hypothetical protein ACJ76Y_31800 [Thermoanaerobaculia bacterium]